MNFYLALKDADRSKNSSNKEFLEFLWKAAGTEQDEFKFYTKHTENAGTVHIWLIIRLGCTNTFVYIVASPLEDLLFSQIATANRKKGLDLVCFLSDQAVYKKKVF